MDTSETYIKMCDCPEIQGQKPEGGTEISCFTAKDLHISKHGDYWAISKFLAWLPRQDQIQEMLPKNKCKCPCCLTIHLHKFLEKNIEGLAEGNVDSMEQLWLAFYMHEKHQKTWNGKKWVAV